MKIPTLKNIFWFGKWRIRKLGKTKFFNRVQWFRDEGLGSDKIRQALRLEKVEPLRQRLNAAGVHGKKRRNALNSKKQQISRALKAHKL